MLQGKNVFNFEMLRWWSGRNGELSERLQTGDANPARHSGSRLAARILHGALRQLRAVRIATSTR